MAVLNIEKLEKQIEDTIVFPEFNLEILKGQSVSIYSNTNVRNVLLRMIMGEFATLSGKITVNEEIASLYNKAYHSQVGISFLDDGLYERLSIRDNLTFFKRLYSSNQMIDDMLERVQLATIKHKKVSSLTYSEKRRVQMARLLFHDPSLIVLEEPDQNVDVETKRFLLKVLRELQQNDKSILLLTGNMESAITLTDITYRLDEKGLYKINVNEDVSSGFFTEENKEESLEEEQGIPIQFNKIPTRVNEKIVLFDPPEIDYIESYSGQSHVYISGEGFPCVFTLVELEERLKAYGFFRCHRSYIVNLQKVREVVTWTRNSFSLILEDHMKSEIPLSKTKMAELKGMLGLN
ncbi:LytTR family transcriptional regulator DNA-binding domain-containing protein [Radiobacillus sp. PE A8.2]|uniref:LytTR family transcriptional regulator DNA-binding domain-containing protein n=1 Tax=Radiobacillus sp. PE A8.2 TaxID=3380349 RepID=UPI00388EE137